MRLTVETDLARTELVELYDAVGWTAYTAKPDDLSVAVANSTFVVVARDDSGHLIGLARGLSDDVAVFYLQDILVHPDHQRRGIGRELLASCLDRFGHVRQKVLLTDDDPGQHALYRSFGYRRTDEVADTPLNAYVRFDH